MTGRIAMICAIALAVTVPSTQACAAPRVGRDAAEIDFARLFRLVTDGSGDGPVALPIASSAVHSSRDQGSITPTEQEAWFSESDSGNVLRIERIDGRTEWVLAEIKGAGALTRIVARSSPLMRDAVLRIRLDGEPTPSIEWPLRGFADAIAPGLAPFVVWNPQSPSLSAQGPTTDPAADAGIFDCIVPIPFASSCVVTIDRRPDLYRIDSVSFAEGVRVERLAGDPMKAALAGEFDVMRADAKVRLAPMRSAQRAATPLAPGSRIERTAEPVGARGGVIRAVAIEIDPIQAGTAVRDLWIECDFDGERAIRMPLGHFIGLGEQTGPTADGFRRVGAHGAMEFRLPMPFARNARVSIANRGRAPLSCALEITKVEDRVSAEPPHLLHGGLRMHRRLVVDKPIEVELARIEGAGVLVGECYSQDAALQSWWPTGDDRLKIDGREELAGPSYDLAFGSTLGLPRLARGLLVSIPPRANGMEAARWSASRLRTLDGVRFSQSLVQTLEVQPATVPGCEISLSHSALWYACAGASRGVGFDDPESMPAVATPRNRAPLAELFPPAAGEEWFEAENLPISFWSRGANWGLADLGSSRPTHAWGSGTRIGLLAGPKGVGDAIELVVPARDGLPRRITGRFVRTEDAARVAVSVNGVPVPGEIALDALEPEPSDLIDLGVHQPKDGRFLVRFTAAGFGQYARRRMHIQIDGLRTSPR
jgi:hypothetical protein